jgi:hypothetical protein
MLNTAVRATSQLESSPKPYPQQSKLRLIKLKSD